MFDYQSIRDDDSLYTGKTLSGDNRDNVPSLGFYLGYDTRDYWTNTTSGWLNEIELKKNGIFGWGDSDFWRLTLDVRRYQPLAKQHTLAIFSLTTLTTGNPRKQIAPWQYYGIGGWNSIRGRDLSSRIGKSQIINTLEYRWTFLPLTPVTLIKGFTVPFGLQLALFGDAGHAWNER